MSSKQDLVAARTAQDVERKYNFGKTFAEVMGMAEEAQKAAEKAQEAADNATGAVEDLDQDTIFNLLTNNGELKGLFMKYGVLYVNASYLATGVIKSEDGTVQIDLSGENGVTVTDTDGSKVVLSNAEIRLFDQNGAKRCALFKTWDGLISDYQLYFYTEDGLISGGLGSVQDIFYVMAPVSTTGELKGFRASWKDNGDGTYTLIGQQ